MEDGDASEEDHSDDDLDAANGQIKERVVGFERPSLLRDLKNILDEYPDDGQIFKEMLQNAEDARARTVKIVSVSGSGSEASEHVQTPARATSPSSSPWQPPFVEVFSLPGLCVYNDAHFAEEDWEGIIKLHESVKVKDPLKVGRFGLGFKSVFHLTDHPVIISGQRLMFMDPFRVEHETIYIASLGGLRPEEKRALRHALSPLLHVLPEKSLTDKRFEGTVFWFPLRQKSSQLSETVYTQQRVHQLKKALRSETNTLLLFLKRIERLEVFSHHADSPSSAPVLDFSVGLSEECLENVRLGRDEFLSAITTQDKTCPRKEVGVASRLVLETCSTQNGQTVKDVERWLVVNFHQGMDDMSSQLRDLCQRKYLTHRPYVGVATKLNSPPEALQGQLFCFLPLPPEKPSPTGLRVHVHGFFELSQNRRHLKWPTSEEGDASGPTDDALVWNRLLVSEVLPRAYVTLVTQLVHSPGADTPLTGCTQTSPNPTLEMLACFLYELLPNSQHITHRWQSMLAPFYQRLPDCPLFFTHIKGGHWVHLKDAVVMTSPAEELSEAAQAAVIQVYEVSEVNLVRLPKHVLQGLMGAGLTTQQASEQVSEQVRGEGHCRLNDFHVVCPQHLSDLMKTDNRWSTSLSREQKCLVLDYLCCHGDPCLLEDLELLPLADGTFCACSDHVVHVCREQQDLNLLPGLHDSLCFVTHPEGLQSRLQKLAQSGFGDLKLTSDDDIPTLLKRSIEAEHSSLVDITVSQDDPWIRQVWLYLQGKSLEKYDHLPLLPCPQDDVLQLWPLRGNYVCERVEGFPPTPPALSAALGHLGVHVVVSLPDFVLHHSEVVHTRVQPSSCLGVMNSLVTLSKEGSGILGAALSTFNTESKADERFALVESLGAELSRNDGEEAEASNAAKVVLRRLELFPVWPDCMETNLEASNNSDEFQYSSVEFTSVHENCDMTPDVSSHTCLPPSVTVSPKLLHCDSKTHRQFASELGAKEMPLQNLMQTIMDRLSCGSTASSSLEDHNSDAQVFMHFFLQSPEFEDNNLKYLAKAIKFVPTPSSRELKRAEELYDPENRLLQDLFAGEDRFPCDSFYRSGASILQNLKQLGLRDSSTVTASDLIHAATEIDRLCGSREPEHGSLAKQKAKALWELLMEYSRNYSQDVIQQLANLRCLPCVTTRAVAPADYPAAVPVCPEEYETLGIARPVDMCDYSEMKAVGSVRPVPPLSVSSDASVGSLFHQPTSDDLIGHLKIVTSKFMKNQSGHFSSMLLLIYSELKLQWQRGGEAVEERLKDMECILTEKDGRFRRPCEFWVQEEDDDDSDLDLSPYRFAFPSALADEGFSPFFVACGCSQCQDCDTLRNVLQEMQTKHDVKESDPRHSEKDCRRDFSLSQQILKAIASKKEFENVEVLLPVYSPETDILQLAWANDCTVAPDLNTIELLYEEEGMIFVHPDLDKDVALKLGALDLRSRTMSGVDDLEMDDSKFGQNEPLTTRLRNLLQDGYTDGFSVPKELMQNADDAGAKVVKFLVDGRENRQWRTGLLTSALGDLQGPALWVFNDAQFANKDFENLCKLGGATKKEDCSKVGKFGLGFNAVYNVTEFPSVYSGSILAMLDPHEWYLDQNRGRKMNFNGLMNKVLLKRMPNQFRPYHGVFGCDILDKDWKPFPGTLFRFPFRTESQAEQSEICKEAFSPSKQQEFIRGLVSKAGNLMLFLQHVTHVELHRLSKDCTDPTQAQRLMVMERNSEFYRAYPMKESLGILDHFSALWKRTVEQGLAAVEHRVVESVTLRVEAEDVAGKQARTQECTFHVAWTTGTGESCDMAREVREEGFVPLAAVGIPVESHADEVMSMESCPEGFYRTGHLFCFLPLAKEVSESCLPVHINAPFALTSDRRGLLAQTEDDSKLVGGRWNQALFSDPIPRAYLAALEGVAGAQATGELYYNLWPKPAPPSAGKAKSPQSALFPHFYKTLVQEHFSVFLHQHGCVSFSNSFFFDPEFKDTENGRVAFKVLQMFWNETEWRSGTLIDLPLHVTTSIRASGQEAEFRKRVITEEQFFRDLVFPKRQQGGPILGAADRNQLVLHALLSDSELLQQLVKSHICIPCRPHGRLNPPARLVHPERLAAPLFSEDDGRFPHKGETADFSSSLALGRLLKLGMVKDKVSRKELQKRAQTVETAPPATALQRAKAIIKYLPSLQEDMAVYAEDLHKVRFLPILEKPKDWPLRWFGVDTKFMSPCATFSKNLKELVGCQAAVLDEVPLDLSTTDRDTLQTLGVTQHKSSSGRDTRLTQITVDQLMGISEDTSSLTGNSKAVSHICKEIYKHLNSFCQYDTQNLYDAHRQVMAELKGRAVLWTKQGFVAAERLAMGSSDDLEPYLMYVDGYSWGCRKFFTFLGVRAGFGVAQILAALKQLASDKRSSQLSDRLVDTIINMANLLEPVLQTEQRPCLAEGEAEDIYLPDKDGWLYPITELCLNDCDWLEESGTMHFLHLKISPHLAHVFRVRTAREHDEDEFCESFGQHEQLTTRINRLLEGYTRDASIFNELLQNADDAGATEVRFVKDLRHHRTEKLLNENWKEVLGPALCVYNDACFTPRDMQGIQALGEGSKEGDAQKTGKYGVGFNAVYNLTDTPCFWTRVVPDNGDASEVNEKRLGEKLCVMDPNFFVASRRSKLPGQQFSISDRFKAQYSNMLCPFLLDEENTEDQTGTFFRLPLRTKKKAKESKIKQPAVTMEEVDSLLQDFQAVMGESLLFLNNVRKVGVYTAKEDGTIELEFETTLTADNSNSRKQREFFEHVQNEAKKLKSEDRTPSLNDFTPKEVAVQCCLQTSDGEKEEWLVVNRFGLSKQESLPAELEHPDTVQKHRLLPLGGVALCLSLDNAGRKHSLPTLKFDGRGEDFRDHQGHLGRYDTSLGLQTWSRDRLEFRTETNTGTTASTGLGSATTSRESREKSNDQTNKRLFHAYCMLPLPVKTGLPVHLNGRFALDHETRRNIDTRPDNDMVTWNQLLANQVIVPAYITALQEVKRLCFSREGNSLSHRDTEEEESDQIGSNRKTDNRSRNEEERFQEYERCHEDLNLITSKHLDQKLKHYGDFFPDHEITVDAFWKSLMKSFYQQLAQTEADVFPAERKNLDRLLWVPAVRSTGFPGFFWNQPPSNLKEVLRKLNMNIIDCPFRIHEAFVSSSIDTVKEVIEETVIDFLRSCHRDDSETDSCNLKHLPKPVKETAFGTVGNVVEVFSFIHEVAQDLKDLPLSLRMSEQLQYFTKENCTIVSEFYDLLPGSGELFLCKRLINFVNQWNPCPEYLREFDISTLVELLPYTLKQSVFGCGQTLSLDKLSSHELPSFRLSSWVKRVWKFIDTQIKYGQICEDGLYQWSLIPALKGNDEVHLFPLKDKHHVVYIPEEALDNVNKSLRKLPLNKLNMKLLPARCVVTKMVASIENPKGLLTALTHENLQDHELLSKEAQDILDFFGEKMNCCIYHIASSIRSLPFFERPDGLFMAVENSNSMLCLPVGIPPDGLSDWSDNRQIHLVKKNNRLEKLFEQLGIVSPQDKLFYTSHLLPSISDLPAESIPRHMEHIKDDLLPTDDGPLLHELRRTKFIIGPDGTLCFASDFFSPDCKVFEVMMIPDQFPPTPYDTYEWKGFLKKVGLVCDVSEEWFLRFARQVEQAGKISVSERVELQSTELVRYLKHSETLRGSLFLEQLKDLKFIMPLSPCALMNGDLLQSIHPIFQPPALLVSFSEGFSIDQRFLVWTSSCILSLDADVTRFSAWESHMGELIGFRTQPTKDLVMTHVKNVCQSLSRKGKADTSLLTNFDDQMLNVLGHIMETIYKHLMPFSKNELDGLQEVAIIFDMKRKAMFSSDQVIITILPAQIVEGHVVAAPETLGKFFDLFRNVGVCDQVYLDHYARALERIHTASQGNILNPNDLQLITVAVHNLFNLLKSGPNVNPLSRPILYLPAEDISMLTMVHNQIHRVRLKNSRELILQVNYTQQKRVKIPIKELAVFVTFDRLGLEGHNLFQEARLLPGSYIMKSWHDVVKETLVESCKTLAQEDADTLSITDLLQSEEFAYVVKRLFKHERLNSSQMFTEDDAKKIEMALSELTVFKVTNLHTVLTMNGSELPETVKHRHFFIVKERLAGGNDPHCVYKVSVYADSCQVMSMDKNITLVQFVHTAVNWAIGFESLLLGYCLANISSAAGIMDEEDIAPYHIHQVRKTVFPPPGSFVPEDMHFLLDNDVYEFKPREYVAYELYDPFLGGSDTEIIGPSNGAAEDADEITEDADDQGCRPTSRKKRSIYIFARVIRVIQPSDAAETDVRTRLLWLRYIIDVGDEEHKEVEACELYKWIRPSPSVIVPFTGDTTLPSTAFSQTDSGDDLKKVLQDIRHLLREIWRNLHGDKSRKRAVKRLLLKWHPDKNPGREKFCTKVFQQIQHYVEVLENGRNLLSDDEDDVDSYPPNYRSRSGSGRRGHGGGGFYGSFFEDIFSRGRSHAASSRDYHSASGSGSGTSWGFYNNSFRSRATPQPEEGRRWMRQAGQDLKAARVTLTHGGEGVYNWACYQAHQTAEKALKAVLYRRDAGHAMKTSHDICSIASCVLDTQINTLVSKLDAVVRHHTRMRYPDFLEFPKIPSDVYSESEAREACDLAEQIVCRARALFDAYTTPPPSPPRQRSPPPPAPRPGPSHYAIASSSRGDYPCLKSSSSVRRAAIAGSGATSAKVPRLGDTS